MTKETELLVDFLDTQREHVLGILEGLDDEQLRRCLVPSGWSPLGLVRHLALDVEHYWISCIAAGESLSFFKDNNLEGDNVWTVGPDETPEEVVALYRREIARSNEIIRATALDASPAIVEDWWGEWPVSDLRFILLHMIEETACHAGHLDVVRELIDGRQWMAFSEEGATATGD